MAGFLLAAAGVLLAALAFGCLVGFGGSGSEEALLSDWSRSVPPWPVLKVASALQRFLRGASRAVLPPPVTALSIMFGFGESQVLYALAKLEIPDHLAKGGKTADELARLSGVPDAEVMWRTLRLAEGLGLLAGDTNRAGVTTFRNSAISATLREDHPNSMKYMITHLAEDTYVAWSHLVPGLRSGNVPWDMMSPKEGIWDYMAARPETEQRFSRAMTAVDNLGMASAVADYPWAAHSRVIDVGGAYGSLAAALLKAHPSMTATVFDLPQVVERAKGVWQQERPELQGRIKFVGGSFFEDGNVPPAESDKDVYVLRVVLHDWSDAETVRILKSVRAAIGNTKAKVAIMETMPGEGLKSRDSTQLLLDMHMYVNCNGKERTPAQWRDLFKQAGLRTTGVFPLRGIFTIVQAEAA